MRPAWLLVLTLWCGSIAAAPNDPPVSRDDPEQADPSNTAISTATGSAVVVTAHPQASTAALAMLEQGGHAVDALVAAQAVLSVVEPQSSGLGGGGFLLHWDAKGQSLEVLDGRETAPQQSRPDDLLAPDGQPLPWREATRRLTAIGIPGTVALLWDAHQQFGQLSWSTTLEPAIRLAQDGFHPSPRMLRSVALAQRLGVEHSPAFRTLYLPGGQPPPPHQRFRNPALALTLQQLAQHGGDHFYRGALADRILQEMRNLAMQEPGFNGWSADDLARYTAIRRQPLCRPVLMHRVCTVPPPSSGGLAVLQSLALLTEAGAVPGPAQPEGWQRLIQALQWSDADRLYWLRDPLDGAGPVRGLLDPDYIRRRSHAMRRSATTAPGPGLPHGVSRFPFARPKPGREQGTTQVSIVDRHGNLASYTGSVETVFGSRHLVAGMVMNNQLTDFSFLPSLHGVPVANRRLPGRRPLSSMAPVIVFRNGQPVLGVGSPGGRTIPHILSRVLMASLIWKEPPARAVALPHLSVRRGTVVLERDAPLDWPLVPQTLRRPDQPIRLQRIASGTALLQRMGDHWHGVADPRREGQAMALP